MSFPDFVAIFVSVVALIVSLYQFLNERKTNRHALTISALSELQKEVLNDDVFNNINVEELIENHKNKADPSSDDEWRKISECLARIEQFAVGINAGVYSIEILDRMAGSHMLKTYYRFRPMIKYKRAQSKTEKRYKEFQDMVESLKKENKEIVNTFEQN